MKSGNSSCRIADGPVTCETYRILHGANYFSGGPIILFRINLQSFDEVFTNQIPGFYEALLNAVPSLIEHHCSEGVRGGFFSRVKDGTLLGHVMEHTAIELQELAGMHVSYGKTRSTKVPGVYNVIFRFKDAEAGLLAGISALNWINATLLGKSYDLKPAIAEMISLREKNLLGPTTQSIADEAYRRKIPYLRLDEFNLVQLGSGKYQKRIRSSLTQHTSAIAAESIRDRLFVLKMLSSQQIPVIPFSEVEDGQMLPFPKNLITYRNRVTGLNDQKLLGTSENTEKLRALFASGRPLIVMPFDEEKPVFRFLVIRFRVVAVCRVSFPMVVGNGHDSISSLICTENNKAERTDGDKGSLGKINLDKELINQLSVFCYTLNSIPTDGTKVFLHSTANPANGCATHAYNGPIHPELVSAVEKSCRILNIDVAGVDVIINNPADGILSNNEGLLEVFASPNFRMHLIPFTGQPVNVALPFVDYLFDESVHHSIPLISVSGSFSRAEFIARLKNYFDSKKIVAGLFDERTDRAENPDNATYKVGLLMQNPENERIIVETSVAQIDNDGLPYSFANVSVILGIDPAELSDTEYHELEDLSYAYSVVAEETLESGFVILNYDDPEIRLMEKQIAGKIIWLSIANSRPLLDKLRFSGKGQALVVLDDVFVSYSENREHRMKKCENSMDAKTLLIEMAAMAYFYFIETDEAYCSNI